MRRHTNNQLNVVHPLQLRFVQRESDLKKTEDCLAISIFSLPPRLLDVCFSVNTPPSEDPVKDGGISASEHSLKNSSKIVTLSYYMDRTWPVWGKKIFQVRYLLLQLDHRLLPLDELRGLDSEAIPVRITQAWSWPLLCYCNAETATVFTVDKIPTTLQNYFCDE